jgi:hypothetical protein
MHTSKRDKTPNTSPLTRWISPGGDPHDPAPPKTPLTPLAASQQATSLFLYGESLSAGSCGSTLHATDLLHHPNVAAFDRIQFRSATANNGKRKAIQEYYQISTDLYAVTGENNGQVEEVLIAQVFSDEIVVRGRSPGHYADLEKIKEKQSTGVMTPRRLSFGGRTPTSALMTPAILMPSVEVQRQQQQLQSALGIVDETTCKSMS